jgi:hypothetical protein
MKGSRVGIALAGLVLLLIVLVSLRGRQDDPARAGAPSATPTATAAPAQASQGVVVPTPVIPLPKGCPPQTAPQIDNVDRYGFCTPVGWGAFNENNSLALTLLMRPRPGGNPILLPTDFDRMVVVMALDTSAPQDEPGECKGPPNDAIAGLAAHHCTAPLNPDTNVYHGVEAQFWTIDLFGDKKFYATATIGADATAEDRTNIAQIAHSIQPPAQR